MHGAIHTVTRYHTASVCIDITNRYGLQCLNMFEPFICHIGPTWQEPQWSQQNRLPSLLSIPFWFTPGPSPSGARWLFLGEPEVFLSAVALYGQCGSRFFVKCAFLLEPMRFQVGSANLVKWNRWVPGGFCHFLGGWTVLNLKFYRRFVFQSYLGKWSRFVQTNRDLFVADVSKQEPAELRSKDFQLKLLKLDATHRKQMVEAFKEAK